MTIIEKIINHSKNIGDKYAIISDFHKITYNELISSIHYMANKLYEKGLKKEDTVIIENTQNVAYIITILAIHLSGGTICPIDKTTPINEIEKIKKETNAKFIFNKEEINSLDISEIKNYKYKNTFYNFNPENISDILFTTGTTGNPVGIVHTHISHYATAENILSCINMDKDNVSLITAPLNHSYALRRFYANMVNGSTVVISEKIFPLDTFFQLIENHNIKSIAMNPSAFSILLKFLSEDKIKIMQQIDYIELGGSVANYNEINDFIKILPKTKIYNIYGSTEAGTMTGYEITSNLDKNNSIGTPNINSNILILDKNFKEIEGYGIENQGFLAIESPIIMKGYLNNDELTSQVLKNGRYITKDIVYRDDENFYYFLGRQSDIISIGGIKVAPEEIENVAKLYTGVVDCGCVGKQDKIAGNIPILFLKVNNEFVSQDFSNHLKNNLELYKFPKEIRIIDNIPRTFNGKIIRNKLKELL